MGLLQEFKEFAMRGNVVDMAVGVVIGGAFGKIVSSLVGDIVMPIVGVITGGVDFGNLAYTLKEAEGEAEAVTIKYGQFINTAIDFIIIAAAIFMVIKMMNKMKEQFADEPEEAEETPPPEDVQLLREIRDALQKS